MLNVVFLVLGITWTVFWMKAKALLPVELRPLPLQRLTAAPASLRGRTAQPATVIKMVINSNFFFSLSFQKEVDES